jgi:hypothetical protein
MGTKYNNKEAVLSDSLIYNDGIIPHSAVAVVKGIDQISKQYNLLTSPYILFQGGFDKLVDPFAPLDL